MNIDREIELLREIERLKVDNFKLRKIFDEAKIITDYTGYKDDLDTTDLEKLVNEYLK